VGRAKRKVHVHSELLRSRSPYFEHILARRYQGGSTGIALLDIDADTFCGFLSWLYANCFTIPAENEWMGLCKLWLLAERLQVRGEIPFCNMCEVLNKF
jgi:hypothetical protein